jgi:PRTRC genetic system protein B
MSKDNKNLSIPAGTKAALCFIDDDQYYLQYTEGEKQAGKFLSPVAVRSAFRNESIDTGWLPIGVNRAGENAKGKWMLRWQFAAHYAVNLESRKRSILLPMPALVWFGIGNAYYIWAMKENTFNPKAELFHAPVANVNKLGLICFGQNAHPDVAKDGFDKTWRTFWEAPFNNDHSDGKSKSIKGSINLKLLELHKAKATSYPVADLQPMGMTLEQAVEKLTIRKSTNDWDFTGDDEVFDDGDE